jgi:hypothetical protein
MDQIPDPLMGDFWPHAQPGPDGTDYGSTHFKPTGTFPIRSFQTFTLTYTVGQFGLDDTGALKIVRRWTDDGGAPQFDAPTAMNYVTATASNGVTLVLDDEPYGHQRPWFNSLRITVKRGHMSPGDTITIVFGDTSHGSPGYRLQTFCEAQYAFKLLADVCATGVFLPVSSHAITIGPGPISNWVVIAPTLRRTDQEFSVGIRGQDIWGNASDQIPPGLRLVPDGPVAGLPATITASPKQRGIRIDGLKITAPGTYRFSLISENGDVLSRSNPLIIKHNTPATYWGDLHGQSGETVGIDPIRTYFEFARDVAFLDVTSHQANDFQVTNAFWQHINDTAADMNCDGKFTVFPGYEWSGNTPVGGDHNVFFADEGHQIRRSSHALLTDRSDIDTDAITLPDLFAALHDEDCVLYAHVGGRPADIATAEAPHLRTAVEVHSDWGTFEWIMTDAFKLGYRVGLVCNSDGHKGAPGACYPGASEFGAHSGLTCFIADDLSRGALFKSMRQRHHYGTTGCRMHMDVTAHLGRGGAIYPTDPRIRPTSPLPAETAIMGDIVRLDGDTVDLDITLDTHAPIERVDILNGADTLQTIRPYSPPENGRVRVIWQGAEYRGRGRTTHWNGTLKFDHARIRAMSKINIWNLDRQFDLVADHTVAFDAVTTGNFCGCDLWLDTNDGALAIDTGLVSAHIPLSDITGTEIQLDAGGLDRKIRVFRLPETLTECHLTQRVSVPLIPNQDNPLWVRVTTEDGFVAWSSPIYVTR